MNRVLITGGTGFVGYWMRKTQPKSVDAFYLSRLDYMCLSQFPLSLNKAMDWDYIVHLANIEPSIVIMAARESRARLLYCSSGIVYHPEADSEYRQNKLKWEQECLNSGVKTVIARLFTFYGHKLDNGKAITQFLKAAKFGKPLNIWGDGTCVRSYMSGETLGKWMWAILLFGQSGEAYDVGSDIPVTMQELAQFIISHYNSRSSIVIQGGKDVMPVYLPQNTGKTKRLFEVMEKSLKNY